MAQRTHRRRSAPRDWDDVEEEPSILEFVLSSVTDTLTHSVLGRIKDGAEKIVHGAVSMVEMALRELAEKQVVGLDDERKAQMVSNLLVVLCAQHEAQPVLNAGTLY